MKTFNVSRKEFEPYGVTCELWQTDIMPRFDRHNEIELNYFPEGRTHLFLTRPTRHYPASPYRSVLGIGAPSYRTLRCAIGVLCLHHTFVYLSQLGIA